jgi:hypothetical protein
VVIGEFAIQDTAKETLMSLTSFRRRLKSKPRAALATDSPRPWPVDPELSRRVIETRRQIERTRRELARHVLPDRWQRGGKRT